MSEFFQNVFLVLQKISINALMVLGYKLTLQRNSDNQVLIHPAQAEDAANLALAGRIIINGISLHYRIIHQVYRIKNYCWNISYPNLQQIYH